MEFPVEYRVSQKFNIYLYFQLFICTIYLFFQLFICKTKLKSKCELFIHVRLLVTPWNVACQAPLSMEFSSQEYWSGQPFLCPGDLSQPGIEPGSSAKQADSLPSEPPGKLISNFSAHSSLSVPNTVDQFQKDSPTLQGNQLPFRKTRLCKGATWKTEPLVLPRHPGSSQGH